MFHQHLFFYCEYHNWQVEYVFNKFCFCYPQRKVIELLQINLVSVTTLEVAKGTLLYIALATSLNILGKRDTIQPNVILIG